MSAVQLEMLTADDAPAVYVCPTCRGNRQMLRRLYPDERVDDGPESIVCACRTCNNTGTVTYDPDDHSTIPY